MLLPTCKAKCHRRADIACTAALQPDHAVAVPPLVTLCTSSLCAAGNVEMLVRGSLPGSHWDWQAGADFSYSKWEGEDAGSSEAAPSSTPGSDEDAAGSGDEVAEGQPAPQGDPTSEGDPTMHPHASSRPGAPLGADNHVHPG